MPCGEIQQILDRKIPLSYQIGIKKIIMRAIKTCLTYSTLLYESFSIIKDYIQCPCE